MGIHRAAGTEARPDEPAPLNSSLSWALSQLLPGREDRTELEPAVPDMALAELRNRAARASRASRDVALFGIRQHRGLRQPPTTREWRRRLDLLPFLYLTRPLGHLSKRF